MNTQTIVLADGDVDWHNVPAPRLVESSAPEALIEAQNRLGSTRLRAAGYPTDGLADEYGPDGWNMRRTGVLRLFAYVATRVTPVKVTTTRTKVQGGKSSPVPEKAIRARKTGKASPAKAKSAAKAKTAMTDREVALKADANGVYATAMAVAPTGRRILATRAYRAVMLGADVTEVEKIAGRKSATRAVKTLDGIITGLLPTDGGEPGSAEDMRAV